MITKLGYLLYRIKLLLHRLGICKYPLRDVMVYEQPMKDNAGCEQYFTEKL